MGWEKRRGEAGSAGSAGSAGDLHSAAAVSAMLLPVAGIMLWIHSFGQDDYGVGYGGAFGAVCLIVFAPLLLPVLGMVQAVTLVLPSVALARLAHRRLGGPTWLWHLLAPVVPAAVWGGLAALLWHWPPTATALVLAGLGVLPTLGVGYLRRRSWGPWGVWWRAGLGAAGLCVLIFAAGVLASVTGLIGEYEPPKLTASQLAGEWHGDAGAVLRLDAEGRATATRLPTETTAHVIDEEFVRCGGPGAWKTDRAQHPGDRDGILVRLKGNCGGETRWSIGGTEDAPELFVIFGDLDAGDLWILKRTAST